MRTLKSFLSNIKKDKLMEICPIKLNKKKKAMTEKKSSN
jgi:hypothetical protein